MVEKLKVLDLFSGIGGFSLGLERTGGFETVAFCEIEEFPRRVLAKHWPKVPCYNDVRTLTADVLHRDGISVDVITGGFPCQDISVAGKQSGMGKETRSGLWSEIDRLIGDFRPSYVIVENVSNLLSGPSIKPGGWFGRVLGDLARRGYDAEWENIPAGTMGAPHRRERIWIVAYPKQKRSSVASSVQCSESDPHNENGVCTERPKQFGDASNGNSSVFAHIGKAGAKRFISEKVSGISAFSWCQNVRRVEDLRGRSDIPTPLFRGSRDGVPNWVDRVGACGNAVIPQIPELIGRAILETRTEH